MADPTYDVLFSGDLLGSAELDHVKQRVAELFKLDQAGTERLFSGKQVFIKRGVDHATAERFREAFRRAGAVAEVVRVGGAADELLRFDDSDDEDADAVSPAPASTAAAAPPHRTATSTSATSAPETLSNTPPSEAWSIAPPGAELEELSDLGPPQHPDTSKLSLVEGDDWSPENSGQSQPGSNA